MSENFKVSEGIQPDETHHYENTNLKAYGIDLVKTQQNLNLRYFDIVKLINYVRSELRAGRGESIDLSTSAPFQDDQYLKPVIEDDPLLCSIEEIFGSEIFESESGDELPQPEERSVKDAAASTKVAELQESLRKTRQTLKATEQRLELALQTLKSASDLEDYVVKSRASAVRSPRKDTQSRSNYDSHGLHRSMLSDRVRTDGYRNFILGNKHLFKDKVVLDVGCGTGILSLFCAESGAKLVLAVEQSKIIDVARENVIRAKKDNVIEFFHGKIEDVSLPVSQVDIIVSEWMGYCLLFENMLDSILFARDKYLSRTNGLMVPSHTTLYLAPFADPSYVADRVHYWNSVYGYDMTSMHSEIYKEVDVDSTLQPEHLLAPGVPFLELDLHKANISNVLLFDRKYSFNLASSLTDASIDGFAIWFDVHFTVPSRSSSVSNLSNSEAGVPHPGPHSFTTGPYGPTTHWHQGLCLIDRREAEDADPDLDANTDSEAETETNTAPTQPAPTPPKPNTHHPQPPTQPTATDRTLEGNISFWRPSQIKHKAFPAEEEETETTALNIGIKWEVHSAGRTTEAHEDGDTGEEKVDEIREQVWHVR